MRDVNSNPAPFNSAEIDEASWMDSTLKTRVTNPGADPITTNLRSELGTTQSYYDTRWPFVNQLLATVERITNGKAGVIQRLVPYLIIGGTAAVCNLILFAIFAHYGSINTFSLYTVVAYIVVYGVSIMANFIPNDYFTFSHLDGHNRSWIARCTRFYMTSLSGVVVTIILHQILYVGFQALHAFHNVTQTQSFVAQFIALILAVVYNFIVHHIFTYASTH